MRPSVAAALEVKQRSRITAHRTSLMNSADSFHSIGYERQVTKRPQSDCDAILDWQNNAAQFRSENNYALQL